MSDISNQLIKDSFNYVLQSDLATGVVYRIGGAIPVNPIFQSGLTIQQNFKFSDGTEGLGYVLTSDASGNASWQPVSAATPSSGVTSISVGNGLSANTSTGAVFIEFTGSTGVSGEFLPLSGGTVTGGTIFTSGLTANTLNVTGLTRTSGITSTGGITFPQVTINSSYTAKTSDYMIDVSGGTFSLQLPTAIGIQGKLLAIKNNGGGAVTILPYGSELIDDKLLLILGETNAVQLVSNGSQWVILGQDRSTVNNSTGVFQFSGITKVSSTQFNVSRVRGWIVDDTTNPLSPQIYYVDYSGGTHTDLYVNTSNETFIYLTSGGTIGQSSGPLTEQQRRQNIFLGKVGHPDRTTINLVFSQPDSVLSPLAQLRDMFVPINLINGGVYPSANGANLNFNTSAGYLYGLGINFTISSLNPNTLFIPGASPCTFQYRTQTGGTIVNTTTIDPTKYDVGGAVTNITGTKATNQRIFLLQNGTIRVQYGQNTYNSLTNAIQSIQTETFTTFPNFTNNAVLIGILSVLSSCTDLSDVSKAQFFFASKFGETIGAAGGVATTTLQQAYNNSSTPEIIISSLLDGLSIQNGTGNPDNTTHLLEGVNTAGVVTSFIQADGSFSGTGISGSSLHISGTSNPVVFKGLTANTSDANVLSIDTNGNVHTYPISSISGSSSTSGSYLPLSGGNVTGGTIFTNGLTANTISATTYFNLPTDIRVTGGTYNGGEITFRNNTGGTFVVSGITVTSGYSSNYYGSFSNNSNLPVSGANVATVWTYDTTEISNGIVVQNNSQIKVNNTGVYEFGYSPQIEKTQGTDATITIWATINGSPVTRTSSTLQLVANSVLTLPFVSFIFQMNANDYVEFYFSSDNQYVQLTSLSGLTTPTRPNSPALIVVAKQIGNAVTNTLTGSYLPLSGGTVTGSTIFTNGLTANTISSTTITTPGVTLNNGLTASTISATTYQNLPIDIRVTGGTYSNGTATFTNNTGGTFNVSGFKTNDVFVTGGTKSGSNVTFTNNTGGTFNVSGFSDTFVTGSTYTPSTGSFLFRNNTGGTFNVGGLNYVTGGTYDSGSQTLSLITNTGSTISIGGFPTQVGPAGSNYEIQYNASNSFGATSNLIYNYDGEVFNSSRNYAIDSDITYSSIVGGSDHSLLTASFRVGIFAGSTNKIETNSYDSTIIGGNTNTIRSGSYNCSIIGGGTNLIDASVESVIIGGSNNTINSGTRMILLGTQSITPTTNDTVYVPYLSLTSGLSNDDTNNDILVRNPSTGIIDYRSAGSLPNTYVTGATYSNNTFTYTDNSNNSFSVLFNTLTGLTINGNLTTTGTTSSRIISATTYQNLPTDVRVTGSTYSNNTFTFTNNTGGTFNVLFNTLTGLTINGNLSVTGTTSSTSFSGGSLTLSNSASTISLNNTSRQQIRFFSAGTGAPTYNTYSAGAKIIFSDNISSISSGYAIGVDAGSLWYGSDLAGNGHDWYAGTRKLASLIGSAGFQLIGLGGPTTTAMVISGTAAAGSKGGPGYIDFLQVINNWSGATNPNKWFRVNSTGGLELLNSVYTATTLTLSDNGILSVGGGNPSTSSSNDGTNNYLSFNGNNSQIYDDGNMHIHSRSAGQSMWINTNGGTIIMGNQAPVGGGSVAVGVAIGSGTSLNGYVTIHSTKSFSTSAAYGYLTTAGAGTFGGGAQTLPISLYAAGRIWGAEIDAFSDERMKDIQGEITLEEGLKLVNNLKPIKYTWKESEDKGIKAGYSAQQVVKAGFNHLIGVIPKEGLEETIDDDGFVSPKDTQFSMNYDQVTPYHGVVIKHLLEKIEQLESMVKDLQSKIK